MRHCGSRIEISLEMTRPRSHEGIPFSDDSHLRNCDIIFMIQFTGCTSCISTNIMYTSFLERIQTNGVNEQRKSRKKSVLPREVIYVLISDDFLFLSDILGQKLSRSILSILYAAHFVRMFIQKYTRFLILQLLFIVAYIKL